MLIMTAQENCYFFCSLIQQYFSVSYRARFEWGKLPQADLAEGIRTNVLRRMELISTLRSGVPVRLRSFRLVFVHLADIWNIPVSGIAAVFG